MPRTTERSFTLDPPKWRSWRGIEQAIKGVAKRGDKVNFVRYADDFIVTGATREILEQKVKPALTDFHTPRGLRLSEQKTVITNSKEGFNFLGHTVRKFGDKLLTKPSKSNVKALLAKVRECIKSSLAVPTEVLIRKLNPILRGWANYYQHAAAKRTFSKVDNQVYLALWRWAERRHPEKSAKWKRRKYFTVAGSDGRFAVRLRTATGEDSTLRVYQTVSTRIHRT